MSVIKSFPNNQDTYIGAEWVMRWHHGRTSGVFSAANNAAVAAVSGQMAVTVSDGTGWLTNDEGNGIVWWVDNEKTTNSKLKLTVELADGTNPRIDRVVVEWETTNYVALPDVKILKGTAAAKPTAPTLTNNSTKRQISLAQIRVQPGATSITAADITDERLNTSVCGLVTETVKADTSVINAQLLELLQRYENALTQAGAQLLPDYSVTTPKLADKSVTRAKLADDAVYSPIVALSASRDFVLSDLGKTLQLTGSTIDYDLQITNSFHASAPIGTEIAVVWWDGKSVKIGADTNVALGSLGNVQSNGKQYTMTEQMAMCALKKITSTAWLITGNVEVVT